MLIPPLLSRGDRIRIVAPSGVFARDRFEAGLVKLENAGFVPVFEEELFSRARFLAGNDLRRSREFQAALEDRDAKALWVARAGYGATRILPSLDFSRLSKDPKWLVGFSDSSALLGRWWSSGVVGLHGANVTTLVDWSDAACDELFGILQGRSELEFAGSVQAGSGRVRGPLLGGNLTVLAAMVGTPFQPSAEGCIVVLEDIGERPYRLDRALTQLMQSGFFDGVVGCVIGQLTACKGIGFDAEDDALDVVCERLAELELPILGEVAIGHEASSRAFCVGAVAELDLDRALLRQVLSS